MYGGTATLYITHCAVCTVTEDLLNRVGAFGGVGAGPRRPDCLFWNHLISSSRVSNFMPPKHSSASKRKASSPEAEEKKSKRARTAGQQSENNQPTNKVLPVHIQFPPRAGGTLRLATWNVCGWAASQKKVVIFSYEYISFIQTCSIRVSSFMLKQRIPIYLFSLKSR
jgi:hypothetical protein